MNFEIAAQYVTSKCQRDKAVSFEKRSFLVTFGSLNTQVLEEAFMFMYTNSRGKSNRSHRKSELQMFSLTSGGHVGVPRWDTKMASAY